MPPNRTSLTREAVAARLRSLTGRLELRPPKPRPPAAPLIRLGGRWWQRDELVGAEEAEPQQPPP